MPVYGGKRLRDIFDLMAEKSDGYDAHVFAWQRVEHERGMREMNRRLRRMHQIDPRDLFTPLLYGSPW